MTTPCPVCATPTDQPSSTGCCPVCAHAASALCRAYATRIREIVQEVRDQKAGEHRLAARQIEASTE